MVAAVLPTNARTSMPSESADDVYFAVSRFGIRPTADRQLPGVFTLAKLDQWLCPAALIARACAVKRDWLGLMRIGNFPYSVSKPMPSKFRVPIARFSPPLTA